MIKDNAAETLLLAVLEPELSSLGMLRSCCLFQLLATTATSLDDFLPTLLCDVGCQAMQAIVERWRSLTGVLQQERTGLDAFADLVVEEEDDEDLETDDDSDGSMEDDGAVVTHHDEEPQFAAPSLTTTPWLPAVLAGAYMLATMCYVCIEPEIRRRLLHTGWVE